MVIHPSTAISSSSVGATAPPPESLLIDHIRAHVKQGEKAKERADHAREKAEQHFISAGQYLTVLKVNYAHTWAHWKTILKAKVKLSTGRASELMQLADGRKDLQEIRDAKAQSVARVRARSSSLQPECSEADEKDIPDEILDQEKPASVATALLEARSAPSPPTSDGKADGLIDALATSDATSRGSAAEALISGSRQSQFALVTDAVADLYQRLSRAGR